MSCDNNVCGVGGWGGPLPGDPDNNITINARTVFSGINVVWSYPNVNGFAVAHSILYRGVSADFAKAIELARVGSSIYLDALSPTQPTTYYYWVRTISINGTINDPIGPASATAIPIGEQTLESLTGLIDESILAQALKTRIDGITLNHDALVKEIKDRLAANVALQNALTAVRGGVDEALAYILDETTKRIDADGAMVNRINAIAVGLNDNAAAIVEEKTVRVGKDDAMAKQISTLFVETGKNAAAIINEQEVRSDRDSALARDVVSLYAETSNNRSAISNERSARTSADSALALDINQLSVNVGNSLAAVNQTTSALSTRVEAVATSTTTLESRLNGNIATVEQNMTTKVNSLTGEINSMWTAKVQVNNLIGGFGLANNGRVVDAGFDVDRFWVGRTSENAVKPFIVSGGAVYIDDARIRNASIDTLKVGGSAITGLSVGNGGGGVPASGSSVLAYAGLSMPSGSSGVVVSATVSIYCSDNASATLTIYKDGNPIGSTGVSVLGGFHTTASYTALDTNPSNGYATYSLGVSNPGNGVPGGNKSLSIASCTIVASGAKR
jgi:hypothetical protein